MIILVVCFLNKNTLPTELDRAVLRSPSIDLKNYPKDFEIRARKHDYAISPFAHYKISGMVMNKFTGAEHIAPSADREINPATVCLTWGDNLSTGVYKDVRYTRDFCTNYAQQETSFNYQLTSRQRLLAEDKKLIEKIENLHVGDQVTIEGYFVRYGFFRCQ